jgi:IclR family acetate operon transcriptional repressor
MPPSSENTTIQSVTRALALLERLALTENGMRLSDLAKAEGLAISTTHRMLTTLEDRGFAQTTADGLWHVGRRAFAVGGAYTRRLSFLAPAQPVLRRLRDETRETANLGRIEEGEVVTLAQSESREIMRAIAAPGGHTPVMNSGIGKAIAATWPDAAIAAHVARYGLRPMTRNALGSIEAVMAQMAVIRTRGYAVDDEEFVMGMRCVAAVVWSPEYEPVCAISISGLAARVTPDRVAEIGAIVRRSAEALTEILGGRAAILED